MNRFVLTAIFALGLTVPLIGLAGCSKANRQPTLHVESYDSCERPQLVGVVGDKEFALNLDVDTLPVVEPCYGPPSASASEAIKYRRLCHPACPNPGMSLKDIGKDYPATVDLDHTRVVIEIPNYEIPTPEEFRKGNTQGHQNGTKKAVFLIDRMREKQTQ